MRRPVVLALISLALLSPVTAAGWIAKGDLEPSTRRDAGDGYMFPNAPQATTAAGAVYFNGWMSNGYIINPANNPNVAQVGSGSTAVVVGSAVAPADAKAWALLGVWMDCNRDGYIGAADPGLFEYPATKANGASVFGVDEGLCPPRIVDKFPGTGVPKTPSEVHTAGLTHNDGKWIHEFIPIGWNRWETQWDDTDPENGHYTTKPNADSNQWDINDSKSRVWMDVQLPEARGGGSGGCYIVPHPRGTYHSTGGVVEEYDCFLSFRVTDALNGLAPTLDSTPAGQITFTDKPRDQSTSASKLNQPNPWGDEKDGSYVQPWNCNADQVRSGDPTTPGDGSDSIVNVSMPRAPPGGADANPSPAGTANATFAGFDQCERKEAASSGNLPYALEGDVINSAVKVMPDDTLHYNPGYRRQGLHATAWGPASGPGAAPGTPRDLGVRATGFETCATDTTSVAGELFLSHSCHEGMWKGTVSMSFAGSSFVNRDTLAASRVRHITYYAFVGGEAQTAFGLKLPATSAGSYGSENCAAPGTPLFECDASKWWPRSETGEDTMEREYMLGGEAGLPPENCTGFVITSCTAIGVRVGQAYQLRDIDCYDHSNPDLRREGVHYGVLSNSACQ